MTRHEILLAEIRLATALSDDESDLLARRLAHVLDRSADATVARQLLGTCQSKFLVRLVQQNGAIFDGFLKAVGGALGIEACQCDACKREADPSKRRADR